MKNREIEITEETENKEELFIGEQDNECECEIIDGTNSFIQRNKKMIIAASIGAAVATAAGIGLAIYLSKKSK